MLLLPEQTAPGTKATRFVSRVLDKTQNMFALSKITVRLHKFKWQTCLSKVADSLRAVLRFL